MAQRRSDFTGDSTRPLRQLGLDSNLLGQVLQQERNPQSARLFDFTLHERPSSSGMSAKLESKSLLNI